MKRYLAILLVLGLCLSAVGCTKAKAETKKVNAKETTIEIKDYDKEGKVENDNSQKKSENMQTNVNEDSKKVAENKVPKLSLEIKNNSVEKSYKNKIGKNLNISLAYPTLQSSTNNNSINKINDSLTKFAEYYGGDPDGFVSDFKQDSNDYPGDLSYKLSYNVGLQNDKYISISFTLDTYLGGAHPDILPMSKTYDLTTGEEITLDKVFKISEAEYKDLILKYVIKQTKEKFKPEDNVVENLNQNMLKESLKPGNFYIKDNNLIIYYYSYDFMCYAVGNQEFSIPLAEIQDKLSINFNN